MFFFLYIYVRIGEKNMYNDSGIYCYQNLLNGKKYIGQARKLRKRYIDFKSSNYRYAGELINKARYKYGIDNFQYTILTHCNFEMLNYFESFYVNRLKTNNPKYGYNLTSGGDSNYSLSDHTKEKIRSTWTKERRYKQSEQQKGKNNYNYGKKWNDELKSKVSNIVKERYKNDFITKHGKSINKMEDDVSVYINNNKNVTYSEIMQNFELTYKQVKKICKNIGYTTEMAYKASCEKQKKILVQCDRNNHDIILNVFPSLIEAEKLTGIHAIKHCVSRKQESSGGYFWRYATNEEFTGNYNTDFFKPTEDRNKLSKSTKQRLKENGFYNRDYCAKRVFCYNSDGVLVKTYKSVSSVKDDGFSPTIAGHCCNPNCIERTHKNHVFSYIELAKNEVLSLFIKHVEKPVIQLDFDGNFIKRWDSAKKAETELNIAFGNISTSCRNKTKTCGGYKWMFETDYNTNGPIIISAIDKNGRVIQQIDKKGNIIKTYQSIAQASRNGFSRVSVQRCCSGKQKEHKGFVWKYLN